MISSTEKALVAELAKVAGVKTVLDHVPQMQSELPQLPAMCLQLRRFSQSYPTVGFATVERDYTWMLLVWVSLHDGYEKAQTDLKQLWPALLDLQHTHSTLDVTVREWSIDDEDDIPTFDETRGVYEKRLVVHALTEETP